MRRFAGLLAALSLFGCFCAAPAWAGPEESRADLLARQLKQNPVQVTDHEPRAIPERAAERIEKALSTLGEPFFVVVETSGLYDIEKARPDELIPLLHDRLRKDGVYLVADSSAGGEARQYGGSRPVEDAWRAARRELPYDADVVRHVELFVEILQAPDVNARIEASRAREAPKSKYQSASEERDRAEMTALAVGSVLGGGPLLLLMVFKSARKKARR